MASIITLKKIYKIEMEEAAGRGLEKMVRKR